MLSSKMASLLEAPTIGIDLGTTYCCMSVFQNGKCNIIPIDNENTMASFVSFGEEGRLIGNKAKENSVLNPANTVSDVKRYIGCRFKSDELQQNINKYLYEIIDDNDSPKIKIVCNKEDMVFTPEEISAMLLNKMKQCAEEYFGKQVCKTVITVPANFKDSQRQATIDAARIAGLDPRRIINEPTAAALAFQVREKYKNDTEEKNILVYDFGGGTFDVSIINLDSDILDVKATFGDNYLGGNDIDECLVQHFKNKFEVKNQLSLDNQLRALRRLRVQCEKVKIKLSDEDNATIDLDQLMSGKDFYNAISRTEFEILCRPVINRTIPLVEKVLEEAGLDKTKIDDVLLVGGSTKIPLVRKILRDFFGKELNTSLDPDLAVAMGASIQASILDGDENQTVGTLLLLDVIPLSLGIATSGGIMAKIINRNTPIPAKLTKKFTNEKDNQKKVNILVYEGERSMAEDNNKLGEFVMSGITPKQRGECVINITYEVDIDGILSVTAEEVTTSEQKNILTVTVDKGRLSDAEIQKMIETAKKLEKEDKIKQQIVLARISLESLCIDAKHKANKYVNEKGDCYKIIEKCDKTLNWLQQNHLQTQDEYESKKTEVNNFIRPIMIKYM